MPKHHCLHLAAAATLVAQLLVMPAQAAPNHPAANLSHDVASYLGFGPDQVNNPTDPQQIPAPAKLELAPGELMLTPVPSIEVYPPSLPARAKPRVEIPLRKLFCVEYARMRSGLAVFGDAKHWWEKARNLYTRLSHPVEDAVMVFSGSKRLKRGHVAVVTDIVSPREIIVDQANWQNKGEIDHATPVLDVSRNNDWSLVRVWHIPSGSFGSRVYPVSGFIAKELTRQALND